MIRPSGRQGQRSEMIWAFKRDGSRKSHNVWDECTIFMLGVAFWGIRVLVCYADIRCEMRRLRIRCTQGLDYDFEAGSTEIRCVHGYPAPRTLESRWHHSTRAYGTYRARRSIHHSRAPRVRKLKGNREAVTLPALVSTPRFQRKTDGRSEIDVTARTICLANSCKSGREALQASGRAFKGLTVYREPRYLLHRRLMRRWNGLYCTAVRHRLVHKVMQVLHR